MKPPEKIKRLIHESKITIGPEADERILHDALNELEKRRRDNRAPLDAVLWRALMKNKMIRFGTAFVVIIAVVAAFQFLGNPFGTKLTFAQAIEPILNADTASYDSVISLDDGSMSVSHEMMKGSRYRRTSDGGADAIADSVNGRLRVLILHHKIAEYEYYEKAHSSVQNFLDNLKNQVLILKDDPNFTVKELGRKQLDGREVVGFFASGHEVDSGPEVDITIWADVDTRLPVRIERNWEQFHTVSKNMKFDIPLEEDLFSMEAPAGYTVWDPMNPDFQARTEAKFIEGLRLIAESFNNGFFPDNVYANNYQDWMYGDFSKKLAAMNLPKEEADALEQKMWECFIFIKLFHSQRLIHWTYLGKGVRLGETKTPIFWYKPEKSETYRVIYGDLHVKDVSPENLPK